MPKERLHLEHEKLAAVVVESQAQGEFLEWLLNTKKLALVKLRGVFYELNHQSIPDLLAEYHGIDQKKLEKEKRAMLADLRK